MNGAATSCVYNPKPDPEVPHSGSETNADTYYLSDNSTEMTPQQTKIALRINDDNLNHHLPVVAKAIRDVLDGKGPVLPGVCNG